MCWEIILVGFAGGWGWSSFFLIKNKINAFSLSSCDVKMMPTMFPVDYRALLSFRVVRGLLSEYTNIND